jgi:hypothetical protein
MLATYVNLHVPNDNFFTQGSEKGHFDLAWRGVGEVMKSRKTGHGSVLRDDTLRMRDTREPNNRKPCAIRA